jgi:hypothetical protein
LTHARRLIWGCCGWTEGPRRFAHIAALAQRHAQSCLEHGEPHAAVQALEALGLHVGATLAAVADAALSDQLRRTALAALTTARGLPADHPTRVCLAAPATTQASLHTLTRLEAAYPSRDFSESYARRREAGAAALASHPTAVPTRGDEAEAEAVAVAVALPACGEVAGAVLDGWTATVRPLPEDVRSVMRQFSPSQLARGGARPRLITCDVHSRAPCRLKTVGVPTHTR